MGRRPGVTAEDTRSELVAAAAAVFAERGYDGARVGDIARAAGLTTGAIYTHYGNKAELLCEAINDHGRNALAALLGSQAGTSILDALRAAGSALPRRRARGALVLEAIAASRREPQVARMLRRTIGDREQLISELLSRAQRSGEVDPTLPTDAFARLCTALTLGSLVATELGVPGPEQLEWDEVIGRLVDAARAPSVGGPSAGAHVGAPGTVD